MPTPDPLDDAAFLARSPHRVGVLEILADGPMTRRDLHDETGISQPTLGRILEPFRDRNWVERRGQEYALTPWGHLLADDFGDLLETVESIQRLSDVVQQLPTDEMDFDIREFRDATVTKPTTGDVFRHVRRVEELLYNADHVVNVTPTIAPGKAEEYEQQVARFLDGNQRAEAIIPAGALNTAEVAAHLAATVRGPIESGRAAVYLYDGNIPTLLAVADGTAMLVPVDEQDVPVALVETENPTIRSWVEAKIDEYREQSTELTVENLP
jgi:predicted transcriptional regulator